MKETKKSKQPGSQELVSRHALPVPLAAKYIGVTNFRLEELIRNGEIRFRDYGQARVVDADDLDEWVRRQPRKQINPRTKEIRIIPSPSEALRKQHYGD